jgi:hypothetical protein
MYTVTCFKFKTIKTGVHKLCIDLYEVNVTLASFIDTKAKQIEEAKCL